MNQIAYSALIAFISSLLTLTVMATLSPGEAQTEHALRTISMEELASQNSADACWKAIDGRVYDVTDFIARHPTDPEVMTQWCGRDATEAWYDKGNGRPHSARAEVMLADYYIGLLEGTDISKALSLPSEQERAAEPQARSTLNGQYADGTYYAESEPSSRGLISIVEISVHQGRVIAVYYDEIQRNEAGEVTYRKSQDLNYAQRWRAVSGISQLTAFPAYARQLIETGQPDSVDALSGATGAYDSFMAVVRSALAESQPAEPAE